MFKPGDRVVVVFRPAVSYWTSCGYPLTGTVMPGESVAEDDRISTVNGRDSIYVKFDGDIFVSIMYPDEVELTPTQKLANGAKDV